MKILMGRSRVHGGRVVTSDCTSQTCAGTPTLDAVLARIADVAKLLDQRRVRARFSAADAHRAGGARVRAVNEGNKKFWNERGA